MDMKDAPIDGSRVLLHYHVMQYTRSSSGWHHWERQGTKWEECRWLDGMWTPWCGVADVFTTKRIKEEDCIEWMEAPFHG